MGNDAKRPIPRFALSTEELRAIEPHAVTRAFPRNAVILNEGERADSLYVILKGRVKVYVSDSEGRDVVLCTQGPGEYFGEMMLDEGPRSASVVTLEPSQFLIVQRTEFQDFLASSPAFAIRLIRDLIARVRDLTENVKSLALMDVYGRVARLLLSLAEERDGQLIIATRLTQKDVASRVGASREMISRIFKHLTTGGYLSVEKDRLLLHRKPPQRW